MQKAEKQLKYTQCRHNKFAEFDFGHIELKHSRLFSGWNLNFEGQIQAEDLNLGITGREEKGAMVSTERQGEGNVQRPTVEEVTGVKVLQEDRLNTMVFIGQVKFLKRTGYGWWDQVS